MGMTSTEVHRVVHARDGGKCVHCGTASNLSIQHRRGRGMGGSKSLGGAENLLSLCWQSNSGMEADADLADASAKTDQAPAMAAEAAASTDKAEAGAHYVLGIEGMSCAVNCAPNVKASLESIEGVESVEVDFESKTAHVRVAAGTRLTQEACDRSFDNAGYFVSSLTRKN